MLEPTLMELELFDSSRLCSYGLSWEIMRLWVGSFEICSSSSFKDYTVTIVFVREYAKSELSVPLDHFRVDFFSSTRWEDFFELSVKYSLIFISSTI